MHETNINHLEKNCVYTSLHRAAVARRLLLILVNNALPCSATVIIELLPHVGHAGLNCSQCEQILSTLKK